jgi:Sec-independent protein translocase protein TatA
MIDSLSYVVPIMFIILVIGLFIWTTVNLRKQVLKDLDTLDYFKKRVNEVSTKEEIEALHKEFVEKASKINNPHINPQLQNIDGFLRGQYKQLTNGNSK